MLKATKFSKPMSWFPEVRIWAKLGAHGFHLQNRKQAKNMSLELMSTVNTLRLRQVMVRRKYHFANDDGGFSFLAARAG